MNPTPVTAEIDVTPLENPADLGHTHQPVQAGADRARSGVEYICGRLADAPSRASAYECLRRDYAARALLDLPQQAWMVMLRTLLGCGNPLQAHTKAGHGILLRLLLGEPLRALFHDDDLVSDIVVNAPGVRV